jgi:hypothetical protein
MAEAQVLNVDTNVRLPPSVRAAAELSNRLVEQIYGTDAKPETTEETPPETAQAEAPKEEAPKTEAPKAEPPKTEEIDWERRYKTMKGRYDAEIGPMRTRMRDLNDVIASLRAEIEQLKTAPKEAPAPKQLITPQEEEEFGKELLDVVGKKAQEIVLSQYAPALAAYEEKIKGLEAKLGSVTDTVVTNTRERMFNTLSQRVPNWRELNTNEEFLGWLQDVDTYSGQVRQSLLDTAFKSNDAARVAAFFEGFLREAAATAPKSETQVPPVTVPGKPSLKEFAAPGKATSAAPQRPAEKPIITRAQIAKFYADVAAGRYRGRETEQRSFEAQVFAAQQEGRVQ